MPASNRENDILRGQSPDDSSESHRQRVERLFDEHNASLMQFLRSRLRSNEEAREVAQEAYVRLLQLDNPEAVSYFRAFLFKTAGNIAIDRMRKDAREQSRSLFNVFDEEAPSAEQTAASRQTLRRVERSLENLPPKCRKAFLLSRIYGLSTREIASQMHMSTRMIRNYLVQATLHVEECIARGYGSAEGSADE